MRISDKINFLNNTQPQTLNFDNKNKLGLKPTPKAFIVDQPYINLVIDTTTGIPLLTTIIRNPDQSESKDTSKASTFDREIAQSEREYGETRGVPRGLW